MADCAPAATPLPVDLQKVKGQDKTFDQPTLFRSLAGKLQYLTLTRTDIQFVVNLICQRMHMPTVADFSLLKRIIRYIKGTVHYGVDFSKNADFTLRAYSDNDYAGCPTTSRLTGGFCMFLGNNLISWSAKRKISVSPRSTEAEYRCLSVTAAEVNWLMNLLANIVYLSANPTLHKKTKHFKVHYHYVREQVAEGSLVQTWCAQSSHPNFVRGGDVKSVQQQIKMGLEKPTAICQLVLVTNGNKEEDSYVPCALYRTVKILQLAHATLQIQNRYAALASSISCN
ncbi:PREDICTED: uncharacterized protein LOC109132465 [Camelina sativa]|uniref:Uncharacterized protein LOC109132465 n=1 Tax=Camelina sativa TaxID=90675 RepID=A0ABM1RKT5_CAMSA|nr:PREDICTED: uncharacterized protein LOC109132465 [Camelina sativa]